MSAADKLYTYNYLSDDDILQMKILVDTVNRDTASAIYENSSREKNLPPFSYFIMDAATVTEISDSAIGILMKAMSTLKKVKGYLVLVMTEEFLQNIMVRHPEMFNYVAVFHNLEDARAFIRRSLT
ncbi:MAG: hypothetical protein A2176_02635 [Spirochaetes bacterium RBG_13_51_14]|nr:MAG: hypothetical protein A2176_02635 [Spirochaetes bacterium RBG_13_51_14]